MTLLPPTPIQLSRRTRLPYYELQRLIATLTAEPVRPDLPLSPQVAARTEALIRRREVGEPLQYLEGYVEFGPVRVAVDERALIPRPETEQLWELVTLLVPTSLPSLIVEIGTGSGALALALAHSYPRTQVVATDICPKALELARENIGAIRWARGRIELREGDLFEALPSSLRGEVDILVSNPPYVGESEWDDLPAEVRTEPYPALVAGPRGTEVLERLAAAASDWLSPSGTVAVEIGETQAEEVQHAFLAAGIDARIHLDLTGRSRHMWGGISGS